MFNTPESIEARPFRPGVNFHSGKLYEFTKKGVTVIRPWPAPAAWRKTLGRPQWRACRPQISLRPPDMSSFDQDDSSYCDMDKLPAGMTWERIVAGRKARERAEEEFRNAVPEDVRGAIAQYPVEVHWPLLRLCARVPGALDLVRSNPVLAYCLAENRRFHQPPATKPIRAARVWIRRRQRHALAWLGFPDAEAVAKIMRKVCPSAVTPRHCFYLRSGLCDSQTLKLLAYVPRITAVVIRLVTIRKLRPYFGAHLLCEVAVDEQLHMLMDIARMARVLREHRPSAGIAIHSVAQLFRVHDDLVARYNRDVRPSLMALNFPPPPVPEVTFEDAAITPIVTPQELLAHAEEQHNCAMSYAPDVAEGRCYFYRVATREEVCTAAIQTETNGQWRMGKVAATCNRPPSKLSLMAINRWWQLARLNTAASGHRSTLIVCLKQYD